MQPSCFPINTPKEQEQGEGSM